MRLKADSHILVIRLSAMGDVAMTVPVLQRLIKKYPQLQITVLTKAFFKPIFEEVPNIQIVTADIKGVHNGLIGLWKLALQLKDLQIDAVADLHDVLRSKILRFFLFFFRIPSVKIDKGRAEKKELTKLAPKHIKPLKTTHQRYADVFAGLNFPIDLLTKTEAKRHPLPEFLQAIFGAQKKWIGIAPFAAHAPKMYPLDLMERVISALNETDKFQILLFGGGEQEIALLRKWSLQFGNAILVAGKTSFKEELQIISNLDLMLSMDSGNGHLAAMFNIPVISLWGATHPFAGFAPFMQPEAQQILPDIKQYPLLPTSIYGNKAPEGYENVMRSIPPEKVVEKVLEVID